MLKKLSILSLVVILVFSFAACGKKDDNSSSSIPLSSEVTGSDTTNPLEKDDAENMTSSELDEVAKDFVENANPSIIVNPNNSSSNPSSSNGTSSTDSSEDTSPTTSDSGGWTPFL